MIPLLPLKLEHAIREVAAQFERRRRLQGRLMFGAVFLGLLIGLCAVVAFADRVPVIVPVIAFLILVFGAGYKWLYVPQRTEVTREQIALFLDAHHPELEDLIVSTVSLHGSTPVSEWMTEQVFQQVRELSAIQAPPVIDLRVLKRVRRAVVGVWGLGAVVLLMALWQVDLRDIAGRLFFAPVLPLPYTVEPGDARVRRGAHQMVWVTTDLMGASKAIQWRTSGGDWQTAPLEPGEAGDVFAHQLRDLYADTEYQVQVGAYRSEVYTLSVWTPPEVVSIGLLYRYPDYLEMEDRDVPYGGDITAPEGTEVVVSVTVNKALEKASLILDDGEEMALKKSDDALWEGALSITENGTYEVALRDAGGEENEYARAYKITAKVDQPPRIQVRFPRGDDEATAIEEVAFGFSIKDDYMLTDYGLQYEVAGRDPVRISLKTETARIESAEGEYPMALEGLGLAAGDFITWTVWAEDGKPGRSEIETLGDPYFLEIRPFERLYRQAVSNEGGQQGQGRGQRGGAEGQKQVIIAIWNLRKGASEMDWEEYDEQKHAIIEAQENVQGSVRNPAADLEAEFAGVVEALHEASFESPDAALARAWGHAQRAYRYLLQRRPREAEIVQNRQRQRGGGGQAQQRELDGLELAQRRDFREEASTLQQQLAETAEAQNKIEELTRRQAAINEDVAQLISEAEKLEREAREEAERRLEQLREAQRQTMDALDAVNGEIASGDMDPQQARRAREQLEGARRQMSRSAQNLNNDQLQRARAAGNRALDALRDVQEQLGNLSRGAAAERMRMLQDNMDSLRAQQRGLVAQAQEQQTQRETLSDSERALSEMLEDKQRTADQFRDMMEEASALAEKAAESQGLMAQKLNDWLRETSREGIFEDMQAGERLVRLGAWRASETHERDVAEKLDQAAEKLDGVAQLLVRDDLEALERAQERLEAVMGGEGGDGDGRFGWGPQGPDALRRFAEGGFRDWMNRLREAESLLPADLGVRQRLTGIREDLAGIGRDYYRKGAVPQYDLIFERAIKPLTLSAEELSVLIRERKGDYGLSAGKADEIPEQYRARVAEYFKALTESEK
ncbi:MAG: hypothetical protein OXG87_23845 [Gemmatimonadetes bacterium]|nr:hypothetical protein [Gemmatimonadota bacterium]